MFHNDEPAKQKRPLQNSITFELRNRLSTSHRYIRPADVVGIKNALQTRYPEYCIIHEKEELAIASCAHDLIDPMVLRIRI